MMNFEPCNPPLMDPLYLTRLSLFPDPPKPTFLLQRDLKIILSPEQRGIPAIIRPIPVRPPPVNTSPQREHPTNSSPVNTSPRREHPTNSSPVNTSPSIERPINCSTDKSPESQVSKKEILSPYTLPRTSDLSPSSQRPTFPTEVPTLPLGDNYFYPCTTSTIPPVLKHDATTPVHDVIKHTPDNNNSRKTSPTQSFKKSPKPCPYSTRTSPDYLTDTNQWVSHLTESSLTERKRNERHGITESQSQVLKSWFSRYTYLTSETRKEVSVQTGLPEKTVMYWFQNQRRKVKRTKVVRM